jgi:glycine/D-amino acid oxidase-like deaminating enzyme
MSGHGSAAEVARSQIKLYNTGLDWLKSLIDTHRIDCGWNPAGKYHAAATADGERRLRESLQHYKEWGVPFRELDHSALEVALGTSYYHYGYHSDSNIFVQPAALVRGLADNLPGNVWLWEDEAVESLTRGKPLEIKTRSTTVTADKVVIANNGFASKLGFARDRVFTIYTYAALTPELPDDEQAKLGSDSEWGVIPANRLGTTLRRVNSRFMVRSAYTYEVELGMDEVRANLEDCYRRRFPNLRSFDFEHVWGGVTAVTRNGALYFGRVDEGLYVSIGCNGAGMLKGTMFGKLLGEMACDTQSPELADALGFERPSWLPPEPIRRVAVVSAINYQKYRAGLER